MFAALALSVGLGAQAAMYEPVTGTVKAGPLELSLDNVVFTQKTGYVHILFDAYPYADKIKSAGLKSLAPVVDVLLMKEAPKRFPKEKHFKLFVIELSQRDDYGAPRWEKMVIKEEYLGDVKGGKVKVTKMPAKEVAK